MKKWICVFLAALSCVVALAACTGPEEVILSEVSVKKPPAKTSYFVGDNLDLTGAKLLVKYTDGTEKETDVLGSMIAPVNMNTAGEKTVTVTYMEGGVSKATSLTIEVKEKTVVQEHVSAMETGWYQQQEKTLLDTSVTFDNKVLPYETWQKISFTLYRDDSGLGNAVSTGERLKTLLRQNEENWPNKDTGLTLSCAFETRAAAQETDLWSYSAFAITSDSEIQPNRLVVEIETGDSIFRAVYNR